MADMKIIKHITVPINSNQVLNNFVTNVNADIDKLNSLIKAYNTSEEANKISKLKEILKFKEHIESKYSDEFKSACMDFSNKIYRDLFLGLKEEFAKYGIDDLSRVNVTNSQPTNTFSKILANMPPEKVEKLAKILAEGSNLSSNKLKNLYAPNTNPEFENFLKNNSITFLGGGNSKNFKVTPKDGSSPYVLKLEYRLGMPKLPVNYLRKGALKNQLTAVMGERETTVVLGGEIKTLNILTTEFCAAGDIIAYRNKYQTDAKRIDSAINIYKQMLGILIDIGKDNCAFPDMKNSNWLVDENHQLIIADTKAFIFCENNGNMSGRYVHTKYMYPPEFEELERGIPISAEKMHVYMCGKNLYQYLTKCNDAYLFRKYSNDLDFNKPIFSTPSGKALEELIKSMVQEKPELRISLAAAQQKLQGVNKTEDLNKLKRENLTLLGQIKECGFGEEDKKMQEFITQQQKKINQAQNSVDLNQIKQNLQQTLKIQESARKLKNSINDYLEKVTIFPEIKDLVNGRKKSILETPVADRSQYILEISHNLIITRVKTKQTQLLDQIKECGFGEKDTQMQEFIKQQKENIDKNEYLKESLKIIQNLEKIRAAQESTKYVKDLINNYRTKAGIFTVRMRHKADRIEQAMCNIPVADRHKIAEESTALELHKAIASRRYFSLFRNDENKDKIDPNSAAKTYKEFKAKVKGQNEEKDTAYDENPENTFKK